MSYAENRRHRDVGSPATPSLGWLSLAVSCILPDTFEERVPHLSLSRFSAVFDLGHQLWLYPDALVGDALAVRLRFADQWRETLAQVSGRSLVEAVVNFACINQVATFTAPDIDAVPILAIESEARDRERLALCAGFLHPGIAAAGNIAAVADLGDHALEPDLTGVSKYLGTVDLEAVAELDISMLDDLLQLGLPLDQRQFPQIVAVQVK